MNWYLHFRKLPNFHAIFRAKKNHIPRIEQLVLTAQPLAASDPRHCAGESRAARGVECRGHELLWEVDETGEGNRALDFATLPVCFHTKKKLLGRELRKGKIRDLAILGCLKAMQSFQDGERHPSSYHTNQGGQTIFIYLWPIQLQQVLKDSLPNFTSECDEQDRDGVSSEVQMAGSLQLAAPVGSTSKNCPGSPSRATAPRTPCSVWALTHISLSCRKTPQRGPFASANDLSRMADAEAGDGFYGVKGHAKDFMRSTWSWVNFRLWYFGPVLEMENIGFFPGDRRWILALRDMTRVRLGMNIRESQRIPSP